MFSFVTCKKGILNVSKTGKKLYYTLQNHKPLYFIVQWIFFFQRTFLYFRGFPLLYDFDYEGKLQQNGTYYIYVCFIVFCLNCQNFPFTNEIRHLWESNYKFRSTIWPYQETYVECRGSIYLSRGTLLTKCYCVPWKEKIPTTVALMQRREQDRMRLKILSCPVNARTTVLAGQDTQPCPAFLYVVLR